MGEKVIRQKNFRKNCLERDSFTCQKCKVEDHIAKRLEIHHILPLYSGGEDNIKNMITLCSTCHKYAPDNSEKFQEYLDSEMDGLTTTLIYIYKKLQDEGIIEDTMTEGIITYEILYDILRREKTRQELQKIELNFFQDINKYLNEKTAILDDLKSKSSIFAQKEIEKTEKELNNIKKIIREVYEKREAKIVQLALSSAITNKNQDINNLLEEERLIFDGIVKFLKEIRQELLSKLLENNKPKVIKSNPEIKTIRILQPVPEFIGDDLNEYGPFEEEYIAFLPAKTAELLIKNNKAEEI